MLYTQIEEIPKEELVIAATFLVNQHPASILIDSGSSYSFINRELALEYGINISTLEKKDNTLRMCVDYRPFNAVTTKDKYSLPRIDLLFD